MLKKILSYFSENNGFWAFILVLSLAVAATITRSAVVNGFAVVGPYLYGTLCGGIGFWAMYFVPKLVPESFLNAKVIFYSEMIILLLLGVGVYNAFAVGYSETSPGKSSLLLTVIIAESILSLLCLCFTHSGKKIRS